MQIGKKIRKLIGVTMCCSTFMMVQPANAYVWPTIDCAEIASIINDVTNGFSKITSAGAQIKNYISTIQSIGDQASLLQKYAKEVKSSLVTVKSNVTKTINAIEGATKGVIDVAKDVEEQVNKNSERKNEDTENVTKSVGILVEEGETEETVQAKIEETKEDVVESNNETIALIETARKHVETQSADARKVINELTGKLVETQDLDITIKNDLQKQAEQLEVKINDYTTKTKEMLDDLQKDLTENNQIIIEAYDEYSNMVKNYYEGKITKDDLEKVSDNFNKKVEEAQAKIDATKLTELLNESQQISEDLEKLKETILDSVSNNKEYSDEEEPQDKTSALEVKKSLQYAYHMHKEQRHIYLKGIYADHEGGDKSFLLSKELSCDNSKGPKFSDIEGNVSKFADGLRHCLVLAKGEKDYFCNVDKTEVERLKEDECDPYIQLPLYAPYKKEGVYKHILEDYEIENITNLDKVKQFSSSWLDEENEESTLKTLSKQLENIKDERSSEGIVSIINMEAPKLWSYIRRADALVRARDVINLYRQQVQLYLDERDEEFFVPSETNHLGLLSDGTAVISNGILYGCNVGNTNVSGENISVEPDEKYNSQAIEAAENVLKECFYHYAEGASRGTIDGEVTGHDITAAKGEWDLKRSKSYNDSMFHTFVLSTINNYKSSLDYDKNAGGKNIISLQESLKTDTLREDYASGAQIINYSTRQLLSIVDADAQELQSEIISDVRSLRYDYFDKTVAGGKK